MKHILFITFALILIQSACKPCEDLPAETSVDSTYVDLDNPLWLSDSLPSGNCIDLTGDWDTFLYGGVSTTQTILNSNYLPLHSRGINVSNDGKYLYLKNRLTGKEVCYNRENGQETIIDTKGAGRLAYNGGISFFNKENYIFSMDETGGHYQVECTIPSGYLITAVSNDLDTILAHKYVSDSITMRINQVFF